MAQNLFDFVGTARRSYTLLDANFTELYDLRNKVWTAGYAAGTYAFAIDSRLRTIFGTDASASVGIETAIQNHATSITGSSYAQAIWATGSSSGSRLLFGKSRSGTIGSHTSGGVQSGDNIVTFDGYGSDGSAYRLSTRIFFQIETTASSGVVPGRMIFQTADASGAMREALRFTAGQAVLASSPTGGIGYRIGAGGTVTQATSKSTGVTLNTVCGDITMNNAALAASTAVSFTLTNSAVAAGDAIICNHVSGGTFGAYSVTGRSGSGSATISLRNLTAGSLSEAVVVKFVVIKAVTA